VVSVVAGDTLRDTSGAILPLRTLAKAYNGQGGQLATPNVQFFVTNIDTNSNATRLARVVYVRNAAGGDSDAYLVAAPGPVSRTSAVTLSSQFSRALRLQQRIAVVARAGLIERDPDVASVVTFTDSTALTGTAAFGVRLSYDSSGTRVPVTSTLVRFERLAFSRGRIDSVRFVEGAGRDSLLPARLDTTDVSGLASRTLTVYRKPIDLRGAGLVRDTIAVLATVLDGAATGPRPRLTIPLVVTVVDSGRAGATTTSARASARVGAFARP